MRCLNHFQVATYPLVLILISCLNLTASAQEDLAPFISLLTIGDFQAEADCNQDGAVNFLDIAPFILILANSN